MTSSETRPLIVRCIDRMVFEVDRTTLEAKNCGYYDPWCYTDPRTDADYVEFSDWSRRDRR